MDAVEFLLRYVAKRGDVIDSRKANEYLHELYPEPEPPAETTGLDGEGVTGNAA